MTRPLEYVPGEWLTAVISAAHRWPLRRFHVVRRARLACEYELLSRSLESLHAYVDDSGPWPVVAIGGVQ